MFENIGGKIKTITSVFCFLGMAFSVIAAIFLWMANSYRNPTIGLGFGVLIGGVCASWLGSLFSYGFGELIESTEKNVKLQQELLSELRSIRRDNEKGFEKVEQRLHAQESYAQTSSQPASKNSTVKEGIAEEVGHRRTRRANADRSEMWLCRNCGTYNQKGYQTCMDCGEPR